MEFDPTDPAARNDDRYAPADDACAPDAATGRPGIGAEAVDVAAFLERYRAERFRDGVRCPHCDHTRIHRHGSFSERRRYRCLGCGRTFSDLTGTALEYSKKPALWPRYARCAVHSLSVRSSARAVGLSVSTAFRWRHAILREFVDRDDTMLSGSIAFVGLKFAYSEKGSRGPKRSGSGAAPRLAPWTDGVSSRSKCHGASVRVVIGCDRHERVFSEAFVTSSVSTFHLLHAFRERVRTPSVILAAQGPLGPFARFARRIEAAFRDCRTDDASAGCRTDDASSAACRTDDASAGCRTDDASAGCRIDNASAGCRTDVAIATSNGRRFRTWLTRFCGVATKYLSNYLGWHRLLERQRPPPAELAALGWPFEQPAGAV